MRTVLPRVVLCAALCGLASVVSAATPKIGVLLKGRSAFWSAVEKGAREAGTQLGADVIVKAPLSEADISVQVQLLNALAAQGAQAIVIAPSSKETLAVPVASLAVKGVKFVVIDTPLNGKVGSVFIGTDHEAAGEAAGKLLASLASDKDEISILKHSQTSGATIDRENGALTILHQARPNNPIHADIYASTEAGAEPEKAKLLVTQYPATRVILASGTPGTLAMLKVLQEQKLAGAMKLVGFGFNLNPDVAAALESGAMSGWIAQLPADIGAKGVASALSLLKGETVPAVVHTDFVVVTKDNLKEPNVQALLAL